ncbi:MAG: hypothetical protein PHO08_00440 [Methylococcales bacterium]|nr:hypothetical protein [Methylococcales bacterium]
MTKKNTTTQAIRITGRAMIDGVIAKGKQSLRGLWKLIGRPESNIH